MSVTKQREFRVIFALEKHFILSGEKFVEWNNLYTSMHKNDWRKG